MDKQYLEQKPDHVIVGEAGAVVQRRLGRLVDGQQGVAILVRRKFRGRHKGAIYPPPSPKNFWAIPPINLKKLG